MDLPDAGMPHTFSLLKEKNLKCHIVKHSKIKYAYNRKSEHTNNQQIESVLRNFPTKV